MFGHHPEVKSLQRMVSGTQDRHVLVSGLRASARALALSALTQRLFIVMDNAEAAQYMYSDLRSLTAGQVDLRPASPDRPATPDRGSLQTDRVFFFPSSKRRRTTDDAALIQRTECLTALTSERAEERLIVVTYPEAVAEEVPEKERLSAVSFQLAVGQEIQQSELAAQLSDLGFERVDFVFQPGQYAVRGSIVDIYSYGHDIPFRLDFFGDEIESIREFDIEDQLSKNKVERADLVGPASPDRPLTLTDRSADRPATPNRQIVLSGCTGNNLKNVTVKIPLGKMVCVTGVSGSGKSTLINQTLYPILSQKFYRSKTAPLPYKRIEGVELIDKVINVDQSPIGRTPRSNPATYTNVFNDIRDLFAALPESKIRGWKTGRFSFNMHGGRCDEGMGNGYKTTQMHFMPDVYVPCEVCGGQRYNRETLEVRWKGKNIADILDMTVNQAVEFFEPQPTILRKIKTIQDVGLGYIKLGQSSTSLSGGESQRIKLATELSRPSTGKTLYILDEPTTGLHFEDIRVLLGVLRQLVEKGNTVIIIEHNTDVIRACDWIIDLGPEGGRGGGTIVAEGTIEDIRKNPKSITGQFI